MENSVHPAMPRGYCHLSALASTVGGIVHTDRFAVFRLNRFQISSVAAQASHRALFP